MICSTKLLASYTAVKFFYTLSAQCTDRFLSCVISCLFFIYESMTCLLKQMDYRGLTSWETRQEVEKPALLVIHFKLIQAGNNLLKF